MPDAIPACLSILLEKEPRRLGARSVCDTGFSVISTHTRMANGRGRRFLMNLMLASGGLYPLTVIRIVIALLSERAWPARHRDGHPSVHNFSSTACMAP